MGQALRVNMWQKGLADRTRRDKIKFIDAVLMRIESDRLIRIANADLETRARFEARSHRLPFPQKCIKKL